MSVGREEHLAETFVELADTLVADFDVLDFLHMLADRCVGVLGVATAGLMLADQRGELRVVAASNERTRLLELFQLQNSEGPSLECFRSGDPVAHPDLSAEDIPCPRFAAEARSCGFAAVSTLPMRLRDDVIGAMNLFRAEPGRLDDTETRIGQALADVATVGLLQERNLRHRELLAEQLQTALNSRVLVEQAKGVLAERFQVEMDDAFGMLRGHARTNNRRLHDVADQIVQDVIVRPSLSIDMLSHKEQKR